jgi:predicted nucleotidyltransferase
LPDDPILVRFRAALEALYGDRIERVVLFGSRARGESRADSDYDVALFLHGLAADRWQDLTALATITEPILEETGAVLNVLPLSAGLHRERTPLMHEIRRDGLDL